MKNACQAANSTAFCSSPSTGIGVHHQFSNLQRQIWFTYLPEPPTSVLCFKDIHGGHHVEHAQGVLDLGVLENESECDGVGPTLACHEAMHSLVIDTMFWCQNTT